MAPVDPDAPSAQAARFRAFNRPLTVLAGVFGAIYLAAGALLSIDALIGCGLLAFGLVGACLLGAWYARRARLTEAALSVGLGLVGIAATFPFLIPFVFPTLVMMPIAAVALTLPYLSGRPLHALIATSFVVSVIAAAAGTTLSDPIEIPAPFRVFVLVSTVAIDVGLTMILLVQFSARLRATIAEQQRAAEGLRASEERFRTLTLATTQAVWSTDAQGRVIHDSPSWRRFTGRTEAEWLGEGWLSAVHPDDRERVTAELQRAVADGDRFEVEMRITRAEGGWADVLGRAVPVRDASGVVREWIGTTTDLSATKRAQRELEDEARRKDDFLAMLGHELRNPMAPIRSAVTVLRMRGETGRELAVIDRQVGQLSRIVDDLLDVSRISRGRIDLRREPIDLRAVIEGAIETTRGAIDAHGHALDVELPEQPIPVDGDPVRLEQVFANLLHNAVKYTPDGGRITVRARVDGEHVRTCVADTGVGIDPSFLPDVFEAFRQHRRTIDRSEGGLGLGLTLVRRLTEMHGGTVAAHSEGAGRGTEMDVVLPLSSRAGSPRR